MGGLGMLGGYGLLLIGWIPWIVIAVALFKIAAAVLELARSIDRHSRAFPPRPLG